MTGPHRSGRSRCLWSMIRLVVAAAVAATAAVAADTSTQSLAATTATSIEVTNVSPWVPPDGDFRVEMRVVGEVPADTTVRTSIHQRIRPTPRGTLRDSLDAVLDGASPPNLLQTPTTRALAELGDPLVGVVLDIPVRSSRSQPDDRVLLPSSGIHPVTVDLVDPTGTTLATTTVFLNHLPGPDQPGAAPTSMSVLLHTVVDGAAAVSPTGEPQLSAEDRRSLSSLASLLGTVPQAPLAIGVRPTLLGALARSTDPEDRRTLQTLQQAWKAPTRAFATVRMPYVPIDTGGLLAATDGNGEVMRQVALGDETVRSVLGAETITDTWLGDPTVTTQSLDFLKGLSVTRLVIPADRLRATDRAAPPTTATTRALALSPSDLTATAPDPSVTKLLTAEAPTGLVANHVVTALMATWFSSSESGAASSPTEAVSIPASTPPAVVQALLPAFDPTGPLTADPSTVPPGSMWPNGRAVAGELTARNVPDEGPAVRSVLATRRLVDGFRSFAPGATNETIEWDLLNAQTLDRSMSPEQRSAYHRHIDTAISSSTAQVEMPKQRRVLLTSRNSSIPLRFRNDLPYDVTIRLRIRSNRLDIGGGPERTVVLHPGGNVTDLPVTTRAPGATLLRIDATSPDGTLVLPSRAIPVTSSTISGVGAVLSVLSLLVLAGWWLTTVRRNRRRRRDDRLLRRRHAIDSATVDSATIDSAEDPSNAADAPRAEGADSVSPGG